MTDSWENNESIRDELRGAKLAEPESRLYDAPYDPRVANPDPELDDRAVWPVERSEEAKDAYASGFEAGADAAFRALDNAGVSDARIALDKLCSFMQESIGQRPRQEGP